MIGSLFSGIGGLELGLARAGLSTVAWQAETDPFAAGVLERRFPNVENLGDVTTLRPRSVAVLCGGFPCQPASVAGRRAGASDARWLWPAFARLVETIGPSLVVAENVPGLLTVDSGRCFGEVLGDLGRLGYDVRWTVLGAWQVGAPHRRDRVWITASRGCAWPRLTARVEAHVWPPGPGDADGWRDWLDAGGPAPAVSRAEAGFGRPARLRALGNAVVPAAAALAVTAPAAMLERVGRLERGRLIRQRALWGTDDAEPWPACGALLDGAVFAGSRSRAVKGQQPNAWPTPRALDRIDGIRRSPRAQGAEGLAEIASTWATPTAEDGQRSQRSAFGGLDRDSRNWPTAAARDSHGAGFDGQLPNAARAWPTASVCDARSSRRHGYMLDGHDGTTLTDAALSAMGEGPDERRPAARASLPGLLLNPDFVESLMGFPVGWTRPVAAAPSTRAPGLRASGTTAPRRRLRSPR